MWASRRPSGFDESIAWTTIVNAGPKLNMRSFFQAKNDAGHTLVDLPLITQQLLHKTVIRPMTIIARRWPPGASA